MATNGEPTDALEGLKAQREELLRAREQIEMVLTRIETQLDQLATVAPAKEHREPPPPPPSRPRPLRLMVLDGLDDLGWMTFSRQMMLYLRARYGRDVSPTRFSSLAKDEIGAFTSKRPRSVYLCHGLVHDRGEAIKRLWGRSDWPLAQRVVAPTTGRIQHLKLTERLCEIARTAGDTAADPEMLRFLAADHAKDLPGVKAKRGEFELERWREIALELLEELEPRDRERREEAAERLAGLPEEQQLFGVPEGPMFPLPTPGRAAGGRPS
jgi:hypothetical protein